METIPTIFKEVETQINRLAHPSVSDNGRTEVVTAHLLQRFNTQMHDFFKAFFLEAEGYCQENLQQTLLSICKSTSERLEVRQQSQSDEFVRMLTTNYNNSTTGPAVDFNKIPVSRKVKEVVSRNTDPDVWQLDSDEEDEEGQIQQSVAPAQTQGRNVVSFFPQESFSPVDLRIEDENCNLPPLCDDPVVNMESTRPIEEFKVFDLPRLSTASQKVADETEEDPSEREQLDSHYTLMTALPQEGLPRVGFAVNRQGKLVSFQPKTANPEKKLSLSHCTLTRLNGKTPVTVVDRQSMSWLGLHEIREERDLTQNGWKSFVRAGNIASGLLSSEHLPVCVTPDGQSVYYLSDECIKVKLQGGVEKSLGHLRINKWSGGQGSELVHTLSGLSWRPDCQAWIRVSSVSQEYPVAKVGVLVRQQEEHQTPRYLVAVVDSVATNTTKHDPGETFRLLSVPAQQDFPEEHHQELLTSDLLDFKLFPLVVFAVLRHKKSRVWFVWVHIPKTNKTWVERITGKESVYSGEVIFGRVCRSGMEARVLVGVGEEMVWVRTGRDGQGGRNERDGGGERVRPVRIEWEGWMVESEEVSLMSDTEASEMEDSWTKSKEAFSRGLLKCLGYGVGKDLPDGTIQGCSIWTKRNPELKVLSRKWVCQESIND